MKIVFIAGADRTGKSTLCREFERAGYEYRHFDPPEGSPYGEYLGFAKDEVLAAGNAGRSLVVDRYMYCEFPYSAHYGRPTDMTYGRMREIEELVLSRDPSATVVYCETDLASNWERIEAEGKGEFADIEELKRLRERYADALAHSRLDVMRYDFTAGDTPRGIVGRVEAKYRR